MMWIRVIFSAVTLIVFGWVDTLLTALGTIGAGQVAGAQFQSNDQAYVASQFGIKFFSALHVPLIAALLMLLWIWWWPLKSVDWKRLWASITIAGVIALGLFGVDKAQAYYDKTDYSEPYFIMPNESAFWIPDVGDNKSSQTKFGSEAYFQENKIAAKRFVIPHVKLENSGLFSNYYVPAGRLIIVDRTPYSREWVDANDRGTATKKQGFPCQSQEGLNITVGMSIGVSVLEENAAKFLYRFGANPPEGDRTRPEVVFQSVIHSRSLIQVMDTVGRNKVQALVCNEIGARTFDKANIEAVPMMLAVRELADKYFAALGITLDYLGWADTMNFDPNVQKAVNDAYIAAKIAPIMPILTQNANNLVKEGLGKGLETKGLPSSLIVIPQGTSLENLFSEKK